MTHENIHVIKNTGFKEFLTFCNMEVWKSLPIASIPANVIEVVSLRSYKYIGFSENLIQLGLILESSCFQARWERKEKHSDKRCLGKETRSKQVKKEKQQRLKGEEDE